MSDAFEVAALELFASGAALPESSGKLAEKVWGLRHEVRAPQLAI